MSEKIFIDGLIFRKPHENAPDFVIGKLSVKVEEFIKFLEEHESNGWVNIDLKEGKSGKYYAELDTWKPEKQEESKGENGDEYVNPDDLPF